MRDYQSYSTRRTAYDYQAPRQHAPNANPTPVAAVPTQQNTPVQPESVIEKAPAERVLLSTRFPGIEKPQQPKPKYFESDGLRPGQPANTTTVIAPVQSAPTPEKPVNVVTELKPVSEYTPQPTTPPTAEPLDLAQRLIPDTPQPQPVEAPISQAAPPRNEDTSDRPPQPVEPAHAAPTQQEVEQPAPVGDTAEHPQDVPHRPFALATPAKRKRRLKPFILAGIAIFVLTGIFVVGYNTWQTKFGAADSMIAVNPSLEEIPVSPEQIDSYVVAADAPKLITIPEINLKARISSLAVTDGKTIEAPRILDDTGWYEGSSKPGKPGATFITGYTRGKSRAGVFTRLQDIQAGGRIIIELGDGSKKEYTVSRVSNQLSETLDLPSLLETGKATNSLVLITSDGVYNYLSKKYDNRLVLRADPVADTK